jgi:hypothetical protein
MKNRRGTHQPRGKRDFGFWILDFRCWMEEEEQERDAPATGEERFWILDFEFWILDVGWKRKIRSGTRQPRGKRDFEFWILDVG